MKLRQSTIVNRLQRGLTRPQNAVPGFNGNVSINETQTMGQAHIHRMPVTTFLRDTFMPSFQTFQTKHVMMDFYKSRQRAAPFVAEGSRPVNIRRDGFRTDIYTPPFINLSRPYDVDLLQQRTVGESVFGGLTPEERALIMMQNDYNELEDMAVRREEIMIGQLMQTGVVTVSGYVDDTATKVREDTIDFGFDNTINLTGTSRWNQSTSKKYSDLSDGVEIVRQAGWNPEVAVLGRGAARNLLDDSVFMDKYMDLRYAQFGSFNPQLNLQNGNGYAYIGRLTELGIDLYTYSAWYYDETAGILKPYIEADKVVIGARDLGEMLYGAITIIPEESINFVTVEAPRVSKVTVNRDTDTKSLVLKSRPLPKAFDIDSWAVINTI
ncbi:major capsid protein [Paenibacillus piscarius]|uniref:major capsid protein n=1 Tax=Paenibacillus piscarius TaxID=1089681 RepID=UPI001EE90520|nr:major capsid protein [Paenibacillus piscarius]